MVTCFIQHAHDTPKRKEGKKVTKGGGGTGGTGEKRIWAGEKHENIKQRSAENVLSIKASTFKSRGNRRRKMMRMDIKKEGNEGVQRAGWGGGGEPKEENIRDKSENRGRGGN